MSKHAVREALETLSEEQLQIVEEFIAYLKWREKRGNAYSWYWADEWRRRFREACLREQMESGQNRARHA